MKINKDIYYILYKSKIKNAKQLPRDLGTRRIRGKLLAL